MSRVKNIIGSTNNMLTVISDSGERFSDGCVLWNCKCVCGNIIKLTSWQFRKAVSCGCYRQVKDRKYNTYKTDGDITYIYDSKGNYTLIDSAILSKVKPYYWFITNNGYACSVTGTKHGKRISLHNFIFGSVPDGHEVDHINRCKYDNRLSNLRVATRAQNNINHGLSKCNTSGYVGVSYVKSKGKFRSYITVNGKQISLGLYDTVELAYNARLKAEKEYFGEFSSMKGGDY